MQTKTADRTIQLQLALLQEDLIRLQTRCAGLPPPPDVTIALRQFKDLGPAFEAVAAFTSVLRSNITSLDEERRRQVEQQLRQLTVSLWQLHLSAVAPRLERMAANIGHMPIGTRFVLERWVRQLTELREEQDVIAGLDPALLAKVETMANYLASDAPDLTDFGRG
ncbi:hypothetical protein CHU95_21755 [Niveispirillum lacus]|uniref:Uncharacterized protein n=1 Tax=Niveispirillum lacus TaxID=1981099 RepID=A0A255YR99_9PROT|nr:hypothetical protein [Niveispirillum lacus]OYQ31757.1 hypothetical protein CHU95_21755 [Niveispirillum lacus]